MVFGWLLILILMVVLAIGSLLPRTPSDMATFAETMGNMTLDILFKLGFYDQDTFLFNLAEAWWFRMLVLVVMLFILITSVKLTRKAIYWEEDLVPVSKEPSLQKVFRHFESPGEANSLLTFYLQKKGYKLKTKEEGSIVAKKVNGFYWCLVAIHISLLIVGISGIYNQTIYNEGKVYLPEGEKVEGQQIQGLSYPADFTLKAEDLWPEYYGIKDGNLNGQIKEYFAKVSFAIGDYEEAKVVSTSKPITIEGYRYFLTDYGAKGVVFVKDKLGNEILEVFPIQIKNGFLQGSYLSKNNVAIAITFSGATSSNQREKFAYYLYEYLDGQWQRTVEGESELNKPITHKGYEYMFEDANRIAELKIVKKVNSFPLYLGSFILILSLLGLRYFKDYILEIQIGSDAITVLGWSQLAENPLKQELEELKRAMSWEVDYTGNSSDVQ